MVTTPGSLMSVLLYSTWRPVWIFDVRGPTQEGSCASQVSQSPLREVAVDPSPNLPGRQLTYRQHLVTASAPSLELEYSVDLKGRYFKARN